MSLNFYNPAYWLQQQPSIQGGNGLYLQQLPSMSIQGGNGLYLQQLPILSGMDDKYLFPTDLYDKKYDHG